MGWAIFGSDTTTDTWFKHFQAIRNYMFIMRSNDELYNNKLYEALTCLNAFDNIEYHKYIIRHSFETIELIKDKVLNRPVYDLNYH